MKVRITFRAEVYFEGKDLKDIKHQFETAKVLDGGAEFVEINSVEDAETFKDISHEFDNCEEPDVNTGRFRLLTSPIEGDMYTISTCPGGDRHIKIRAYSSYGDNWVLSEICWCEVPLKDFVDGMKEHSDYAFTLESEHKQYEHDCGEEEMARIINTYFNGKCPDCYLQFEDVTLDTPDGNYFSIQK